LLALPRARKVLTSEARNTPTSTARSVVSIRRLRRHSTDGTRPNPSVECASKKRVSRPRAQYKTPGYQQVAGRLLAPRLVVSRASTDQSACPGRLSSDDSRLRRNPQDRPTRTATPPVLPWWSGSRPNDSLPRIAGVPELAQRHLLPQLGPGGRVGPGSGAVDRRRPRGVHQGVGQLVRPGQRV